MEAGTTVGVIETGVPIPPKGGTGKWSAIDLLEVGQSTVVSDTDIYRAHCAFGRRDRKYASKKFSARTIATATVRVWRTA